MKQTKIIISTTIITFCAFLSIIQTSCSRDKCKGVSCENGATSCIDGTCQCPAGYSGNFCELSSVSFRNSTFTPIYINVSGTLITIPVDSTVSFTGQSGSSASYSAFTCGTNAENETIGDTLSWGGSPDFPVNGATVTDTFNIPSNPTQYFFLKIIDSNSTQSVVSIDVNYAITGAASNTVNIPNDKKVHGTGYFVAYPQTAITATGSGGKTWSWPYPLSIPDTVNNPTITIIAK